MISALQNLIVFFFFFFHLLKTSYKMILNRAKCIDFILPLNPSFVRELQLEN
ncbi:hypothetical protein Patl1_29448 [Pistacia atlantica]|uniref:Uncharacterized protein n=1 Tax=Pistacia atlantica TaxID=434234 RepID=A0ACC1ABR3_9ROSI|nr:hypothetical protein Patl1_29448 [Pistacia atlantica]